MERADDEPVIVRMIIETCDDHGFITEFLTPLIGKSGRPLPRFLVWIYRTPGKPQETWASDDLDEAKDYKAKLKSAARS